MIFLTIFGGKMQDAAHQQQPVIHTQMIQDADKGSVVFT